jgi:putative RecB family exonuclease
MEAFAMNVTRLPLYRNSYLSHSRLKLFEQCRAAFFFQYVSPGEQEPQGEPAAFGTVLHSALEEAFAWVMREEYTGPFPLERLILAYREAWKESKLNGVQLYKDGLDILRVYAKSHPDVDHFDILATEQAFEIPVGRFILKGFIDKVSKLGDDAITITDYKSARNLFSRSELATDAQLSIYSYVARQLWPWAKRVSLEFEMIRHDIVQKVERTAEEVDTAIDYVLILAERIEAETEWAPTINEFCAYCSHRKRCPEYASAVAGGISVVKTRDLSDLAQVSTEREQVAKLSRILYSRKEELDKVLKKKLAEDGEFTTSNGFSYRLINMSETSYPVSSTVRTFTEIAKLPPDEVREKILVADKDKVIALAKEVGATLPKGKSILLSTTLEALADKSHKSSRLDARAIKTAKKA